jgi:superfamily II DNA or RNA helicase
MTTLSLLPHAATSSLPQLRDYQLELTADVHRAFDDSIRRVMLYCPTGGGKTEMGMHLVSQELDAGGRPLWLANRIDLIEQTSGRFERAGIAHGILQGQHYKTDRMQPAQIGSIQTVIRREISRPSLILIDEAHGATSTSYRNFLAQHADVPVIGLSATPFTKGLGAHVPALGGALFERLVWRVIPRDLIQRGWLVDCRIFAPSKPGSLQGAHHRR